MRVLLTNDDGVSGVGLHAARERLMEVFDEVLTVAPAADCSGLARACTFRTPVSLRLQHAGRHSIYDCTGTPGDCVRLAVLAGLVDHRWLVVSGINHGVNLGDDVHYSGTIGAGMEASLMGLSALCVSQQDVTPGHDLVTSPPESAHFSDAASLTVDLAARMSDHRSGAPLVLNVNVPACSPRGVRLTRLGRRRYLYGSLRAMLQADAMPSRFHLWQEGTAVEVPEPGSDFAAVEEGYVSVTPLGPMRGVEDVDGAWDSVLAPAGVER